MADLAVAFPIHAAVPPPLRGLTSPHAGRHRRARSAYLPHHIAFWCAYLPSTAAVRLYALSRYHLPNCWHRHHLPPLWRALALHTPPDNPFWLESVAGAPIAAPRAAAPPPGADALHRHFLLLNGSNAPHRCLPGTLWRITSAHLKTPSPTAETDRRRDGRQTRETKTTAWRWLLTVVGLPCDCWPLGYGTHLPGDVDAPSCKYARSNVTCVDSWRTGAFADG